MADILIHKKDETMSDYDTLLHVQAVVRTGRKSRNGESYCYVSEFNDGVLVFADKRKADIFTVVREVTDNGTD